MNNIEINLDVLSRYNLTPNQYVFLFLTHSRQYAAMYKFGQEGPSFSAEEIGNLVDRGLILDLNKSGHYYMDFFVLTDEVGRDLFDLDREKAALEFWNAYPILLRDSRTGENFSLLTTDKQQFLKDYYVRVGPLRVKASAGHGRLILRPRQQANRHDHPAVARLGAVDNAVGVKRIGIVGLRTQPFRNDGPIRSYTANASICSANCCRFSAKYVSQSVS